MEIKKTNKQTPCTMHQTNYKNIRELILLVFTRLNGNMLYRQT